MLTIFVFGLANHTYKRHNTKTTHPTTTMKEIGYNAAAVVGDIWDAARFGNETFEQDFGVLACEK